MSNDSIKGTYCTCQGFTPVEAAQLDRACGKAWEMVTKVANNLGTMSGDVAGALKHHFKLDLAAARGIGRVYQEKQIEAICSVYVKIHSDLQTGMTYVAGHKNAVGTTGRLDPGVISIHPPFFTLTWLDQATGIIHEQAHFASRLPWAFNTITDLGWFSKAYHELNPQAYLALTTDQALKNADCYAYFAREVAEPDSYVWIGN